uniref:Uncharacterized protein n=1 Tax=Chromera velia CCMP2878 TaxID=1169474 RepID=A0A0G4F0T6_9ALVE|eukprot:Cvel_14369.t1-p1 / transcript=Cvel_14369.t1 / gene=Cvel_14369 / organism=Chromera_velia_CCMP2878 / gene_product=hypothetical protein / transcript_product=hypothetical protein / location=Cvel_scaffold1020:5445-7081(-) / protein_length=353 / sequence_SO=supercontig / SO=protein_coding / is_pseudo=false
MKSLLFAVGATAVLANTDTEYGVDKNGKKCPKGEVDCFQEPEDRPFPSSGPVKPNIFDKLWKKDPIEIPDIQIFKSDGKGNRLFVPNPTLNIKENEEPFKKLCNSPTSDGVCWVWADPEENCSDTCREFAISMDMEKKGAKFCSKAALAKIITEEEFNDAGARANNNTGLEILTNDECGNFENIPNDIDVEASMFVNSTPFIVPTGESEVCFAKTEEFFSQNIDCFSTIDPSFNPSAVRLCACVTDGQFNPKTKDYETETIVVHPNGPPTPEDKNKTKGEKGYGMFDLSGIFNYDLSKDLEHTQGYENLFKFDFDLKDFQVDKEDYAVDKEDIPEKEDYQVDKEDFTKSEKDE